MNILVLMTDQLRFDMLGCNGNAQIQTPNLDELAVRSLRFSQACCPTPVCIASRHSFMTGQRARQHHWVANNALPGPRPELPTIMTLLQQQGYHTHAVGKMHFHGRHFGLENHERMEECCEIRLDDDYLMYLEREGIRTRYPQGLRDLLYYQPQTCGIPEEHSQNRWVAKRTIECLRQHKRYRGNQPLFLWASWIAPHPPFAPCEPYDTLYDPESVPEPIYPERPLSTLPSPAWEHRARLDGAHRDPARMRRIRALYQGQVTHVDACIGQVLQELDILGLAEETAIIFTSDHGDMLGDHGLSQKNVPYEASIRVPLIVHWPGRTEPGTVCSDLVGLTDILPTVLGELQLDYPADLDPLPGASLLGRSGGGLARPRHEYVIDYGNGRHRWIALRTPHHKYVLWAAGGREELYDLREDPWELNNIAVKEAGLTTAMHQRVLLWERRSGLRQSFDRDGFRIYPEPPMPDNADIRGVNLNEGTWPENLPEDEQPGVETFAEAFTRAIQKETCLSPGDLSLQTYAERGGKPLTGTPWEAAWKRASEKHCGNG